MQLALAIVTQFSIHLALTIVGVAIAIAVSRSIRRWAEVEAKSSRYDHERKRFELETERAVKLNLPPVPHNGPQIEHRTTDRNEDGTRRDQQ